jgi:hypothetical protein
VTCGSCGASLRSDASYCGQCFGTLTASGAVTAVGVAPVQQALPTSPTYTRWQKTTTSFGPVGRILWTVLMLMIVAMALFSQNPFAIGPLCFILVPLVMRSVWAKSRLT